MTTDIKALEQELEKIKADKITNCGFKKGDCVEIIKDGKPFKGHVDFIIVSSFGSDKGKLSMCIIGKAETHIKWSGNQVFVREEDFVNVKHITNPVNTESIERLDGLIYQKEREIENATKLLKQQKRRLEKLLSNQFNNCIHHFDEIGDTGRVVKHLIGESEVKIFCCKHCGKQVESC